MTKEEVYERLNKVFQDVFDNETIIVSDNTTINDIEDWDSLMHITLISSIEEEFDVKFMMKDIIALQNVEQIVNLILERKK